MAMCLIVWAAVGPCAKPARAAPAPKVAPTPPKASRGTVVLVAGQAQGPVARKVARAVRNHLLDLRVGFRLRWLKQLPSGLPAQVAAARRMGRREKALVVLWCSHATVDQVFLYITRYRGGRILVRQVDRARDGTLGRFEAIGAIVRSGVAAILAGARIGIRPPPPPPPRRPPPPTKPRSPPLPPPRRSRPGLSVDAGYAMTGFSTAAPLLHAGLAGLAVTFGRRWALRLGYRFAPAIRVQDSARDVDLRIFQHALRLGGAFRWTRGRWTLGLRLAAALSIQTWSATAPLPLRPAPDGVDLTFGVDVLATVAWQARPALALYAGLGATALLWNRTYDAHIQGERLVLLDPFPIQPQLVVGVCFSVF